MSMIAKLGHQILKRLPPEPAHDIAKWVMRNGWFEEPLPQFLPVKLFGFDLPNPIGLAAGFDKSGSMFFNARKYGFSFIEVGSLTRLGGPGNSKPRLKRVPISCLQNRMGLNGPPAAVVLDTLVSYERPTSTHSFPFFGVNIAKTHSPLIMNERALEDLQHTYDLLNICEVGMYHVINISCPNTAEGTTFEDPKALRRLLVELTRDTVKTRPLMIKVSPKLGIDPDRVSEVVKICKDYAVDGVVCSNTYPVRDGNNLSWGESGSTVKQMSLRNIRTIKDIWPEAVIIGVGGISSGEDVWMYLREGCTALQVFTGYVTGPNSGPGFVARLQKEWETLSGKN